MMKLWQVHYQDGDHEPEKELFAHSDSPTPRPSTEDARKFLLSIDGLIGDPKRLRINGVYEVSTVHALNGDPYKVIVRE